MVPQRNNFLAYSSSIALLLFIVFSVLITAKKSESQTTGTNMMRANNVPTVSAVTVNNGTAVTLNPNSTTTVTVSFTVSDQDGCGDIFAYGYVTTTLYRSGVSTTCAVANPDVTAKNLSNCYVVATTTNNCVVTSTQTANATATFAVWYFAEATDASSTYSAQNWKAFVSVQGSVAGANSTSSASGVEMNTLLAISVPTSSLSYGVIWPGNNTSGTNQISPVKNAGNSSTTLKLHGTALTNGTSSISTSSQHYATSTFTFGGAEQQLQAVATDVPGFLLGASPAGKWTTTTRPTAQVVRAGLATWNSYIYHVGGEYNELTSTVLFAPLTPAIGSWTSTTPLPYTWRGLYGNPKVVTYNGYIYAIAGNASGTNTTTALYARINATGSLGVWNTTTPITAGYTNNRSMGAVLAHNGYMYIVSGQWPNGAYVISYAPINATGSLGAWTDVDKEPTWVGGSMSVSVSAFGNKLYKVGGSNEPSPQSVAYTTINSDGSVNDWISATSLPAGSDHVEDSSFAAEGFLYALTDPVDGTLFAPLLSDGSVGNWSMASSSQFDPNMRFGYIGSVTMYNGYLYNTGGSDWESAYTPIASRNTYWGLDVPGGTRQGTHAGTVYYTAVYSP